MSSESNSKSGNAISIDIDKQGIATLTIDMPDRSMNVITPELTAELTAAVDRILE